MRCSHFRPCLCPSARSIGLALAVLATTPVGAQSAPPPTTPLGSSTSQDVPGAPTNPPDEHITAKTPKRAWSIVPRIGVTETITDNIALEAANKKRDQITQIAPGIRIDGETARLKVHFDYGLQDSIHAQDSSRNQRINSLNSFGKLEVIEKWMFVDFSGMISQQSISAFGTQTTNDTSVNPNRTEASNFRIAPSVRGRIGDTAEYLLRYSRTSTASKSDRASDVMATELHGGLSSATHVEPSAIGWNLIGAQQRFEYQGGQTRESAKLNVSAAYRFDEQLLLRLGFGRESDDYSSVTKQSRTTNSLGLSWFPAPHTELTVQKEKRSFGNAHNLMFSHRTPLSTVRFSDIRDISVAPNQLTTVGLGSIYDLIFSQFASAFPDPIERAKQVDSFLQQTGLPANAQVVAGFLTSRVTVQRRQELAAVLIGKRNTLTLAATRSEQKSLGTTAGLVTDDFDQNSSIRQRGISVSWAYRLSPLSSLNVLGSWQDSVGSSAMESSLKSLNINFSTRLSEKTTASLGTRRTISDSSTTPYRENAVTGALTAQF